MRHRAVFMILIALCTHGGSLGTLGASRVAANPVPGSAPAPGDFGIKDWRTYHGGLFGNTAADPIDVVIYGPNSIDENALATQLETSGWSADEPGSSDLVFTTAFGVGPTTADFLMSNDQTHAVVFSANLNQQNGRGFTFYVTASTKARAKDGFSQGRDTFVAHVLNVANNNGWAHTQYDLTGVGTTGDNVDGAVSDGHAAAICLDQGKTGYCDQGSGGPPVDNGQAPTLSVAFDHDTYQGGAADNIALAPGQTSDPITVVFQNTSDTNTLYRSNVVLANFLPENDQPAQSSFCDPGSARACQPFAMVSLGEDCKPHTPCSFTYRLHAPADFTGTVNVTWRVAVLNANGSFQHWINDANNQQTYEVYNVTAAG